MASISPSLALEKQLADSHVISGTHYEVESNAEPVDTKVMIDHIEGFHQHLHSVFDGIATPLTIRESVRYCRDRKTFLAYGQKYCPQFSDGWYGYQMDGEAKKPGEIVLMFLGANYSVLQHEAFHRFMFRAYPGIRAWPRWFDEGLADWIARGRFFRDQFTIQERLDAQDMTRVSEALSNHTFIPLEELIKMDGTAWNGKQQALIYAEWYLFSAWLMRVEDKPFNGLMRSFLLKLKKTQDYDMAFTATIGAVGIKRLQTAWLEWLRAIK